ncbi:MAG TPA: hypothetical protein DEP28_08235 [Bacteroidetes bacterium]|nr:hypothetical protein [Bacteroidota bacterium]
MKKIILLFSFVILTFSFYSDSYSNNLKISNYTVSGQLTSAQTLYLKIENISWDNSWRNDIPGPGFSVPNNYDAVWIFAKFRKRGTSDWLPMKFSPQVSDHIIPLNSEIKTYQDSMGVMLYRKSNGTGTFSAINTLLKWRYAGYLSNTDTIDVKLFGIEMVYVPQGSFYVGDYTPSNVTGQFVSNDNVSPYQITSENSITLGGNGVNNLKSRNNQGMSTADDFTDAQTQTLPQTFPKGYNDFFAMKYEVSMDAYVDFLNCLSETQANSRYPASAFGFERFNIEKVGNTYRTPSPDRAVNMMAWSDCAAYLDWTGLRPFTELEYEKMCRGPLTVVSNEYAWGNTNVVQIVNYSGVDSLGTVLPLPDSANCQYNLVDGGMSQFIQGPVRVGIFATANSNRTKAGASYYGIMELSGNTWERPVTVGNSTGRQFINIHGNGLLTANGDADVQTWPGVNSVGSGFRGGNWFRGTLRLRVADRFYANTPLDNRTSHRGIRGVRAN